MMPLSLPFHLCATKPRLVWCGHLVLPLRPLPVAETVVSMAVLFQGMIRDVVIPLTCHPQGSGGNVKRREKKRKTGLSPVVSHARYSTSRVRAHPRAIHTEESTHLVWASGEAEREAKLRAGLHSPQQKFRGSLGCLRPFGEISRLASEPCYS